MKRVLIGSILVMGLAVTSILNINYFNTKTAKKEGLVDYLALDSTTALKNITINKEIIDAKEYYAAGDDIKYKITVTNNNSEAVKVNIIDNYSNLERNQSNLVIESAKCNEKDIAISKNELNVNEIEIASKATYTCTIDAYTKKTYPEGKVNSRAKVYIDDEDEYNEAQFTYLVRDSILDIQVNEFNKYSFNTEEDINYQLKIKNLSSEKASGKIVFEMRPGTSNTRLNEDYKDNYNYSFSGKTTSLVDNSKIKFKCVAKDGGTCVTNQTQILTFTIAGINPGETMTLNITLNNTSDEIHEDYIHYDITEYDIEGKEVIKKSNYTEEIFIKRMLDLYTSIYPVDKNNQKITDLTDLEFKQGKARIYLNYDFNRYKDYKYGPSPATPRVHFILPTNIEYDNSRKYTYTNCVGAEGVVVNPIILSDGRYELRTQCSLGDSTSNFIYDANVKVPIAINNRLINQEICLDAREDANKYCFGADLKHLSSSAIQLDNNIIDLKLQFINDAYIGNAKNAVITYEYDAGLEIDESTLVDATIDKENRTITWIVPLIRKGEIYTIELKAKNNGGLTDLLIKGKIEQKSFRETISLEQEEKKYLKGDWNLNGEVNINDVIYARKYLAKIDNIALPPVEVYDFNDDKEPNIVDLVMLRKYISER